MTEGNEETEAEEEEETREDESKRVLCWLGNGPFGPPRLIPLRGPHSYTAKLISLKAKEIHSPPAPKDTGGGPPELAGAPCAFASQA
ncbi:unnamed protein product [Gadus morhua 'NCC']